MNQSGHHAEGQIKSAAAEVAHQIEWRDGLVIKTDGNWPSRHAREALEAIRLERPVRFQSLDFGA
jgi:hypothetical protein